MRPTRTKRGLMAPQPAAQIAALDFAHQSEAMDRAFKLVASAKGDAEADAAFDVLGDCIDRLLSIPARTPGEIAQKVRGQAWLHTAATVDLADEADRRSLFASTEKRDEDAKGLLTIYLDLAALSEAQDETQSEPEEVSEEEEARMMAEAFDAADMPVWPLTDTSVPTNDQMAGFMFYVRLAHTALSKSKPELLTLVNELDNGEPWGPDCGDANPLAALLHGLTAVEDQAEAFRVAAGAATARVLSALGKLTHEAAS